MLPESMCRCICGKHEWGGGGGYIGPGITYTNFKCKNCDRGAAAFEAPYILVVMETYMVVSSCIMDYTNKILLPAWREAKEAGNDDPTPPLLPDSIRAFKRVGGDWVQVDQEKSAQMPLPIDPIKTRHNLFWGEILQELDIKDKVKEIPNGYYDDHLNNEPWYELELKGAKVVFGPRKRVLNITVTRDSPFDVTAIAAMAKEDNTSYWSCPIKGALDEWHNWESKKAVEMTVHAWTQEKFIRYFKLIELGLVMTPA